MVSNAEVESLLLPYTTGQATTSRIRRFARWASRNIDSLYCVNLAQYRDDLRAAGHKQSTISAYLSAIRASYAALLEATNDPNVRETIRETIYSAPCEYRAPQWRETAINAGTWLTREQASAFIALPGQETLVELRDTSILALLLCTGLRVQEASALLIQDLRQIHEDQVCCYVRNGKGSKSRYVPYGDAVWCLDIVDKWIEAAGIEAGPVFRAFYKPKSDGTRTLRPGRLSTRGFQKILERYPLTVEGRIVIVKPHDLRRTYARRCYDEGINPLALCANLGHESLGATLLYLGKFSSTQSVPTSLYIPPTP
jgi:site-specific recombinase XerD